MNTRYASVLVALSTFLLVPLVAGGCDPAIPPQDSEPIDETTLSLASGVAIARLSTNGDILPLMGTAELETFASEELRSRYALSLSSLSPSAVNDVRFTDVQFDGKPTSEYRYLIIRGKQPSGSCYNLALPLLDAAAAAKAGADGIDVLLQEVHTCTGAPCDHCEFKRDFRGAIIGCQDCEDPPEENGGQCNHTVSGG